MLERHTREHRSAVANELTPARAAQATNDTLTTIANVRSVTRTASYTAEPLLINGATLLETAAQFIAGNVTVNSSAVHALTEALTPSGMSQALVDIDSSAAVAQLNTALRANWSESLGHRWDNTVGAANRAEDLVATLMNTLRAVALAQDLLKLNE
jgi:hypothetical protein